MLGAGGTMWTKQMRFLPSWSLYSSREGRQKNPINQCIIMSYDKGLARKVQNAISTYDRGPFQSEGFGKTRLKN